MRRLPRSWRSALPIRAGSASVAKCRFCPDARRRVVVVLAGQGAAPRLATREYFAQRGGIPGKGIEPAAVPAAFDACITLLDRYGTLQLADVAEPALKLLDRARVEWHPLLARSLRRLIDAEASGGGDRSRGLRLAADYFYRGPLARELADWCERMDMADPLH